MSDVLYLAGQLLLLLLILGIFLVMGFAGAWLRQFYRDIGWIRDAPWPRRRGDRKSSRDRPQDDSVEDHQ